MPANSIYIFDACATIALLEEESGAETVETLLAAPNHRCIIHILNACEVYYHICRCAGRQRADQLKDVLESYGFELEDSLVPLLWQEAGLLKAEWRRVSLADCFALALAMQKKATLVTSDHHEFDPVAKAGLCPILFFR